MLDLKFYKTERLDWQDIAASAIIFLALLGFLHYPARATLPEFSEAILVQNALSGASAPVHSQIAAMLVPPAAQLAGVAADSPQAIVFLLLELSPLLLPLTALFIYAALRSFGSRRSVSALFALLSAFLLSPQFLPGIYGGSQAAAPLFALFLLSMCRFAEKKGYLPLAGAIVFAAASAYVSPSLAVPGAALALSFAAGQILDKAGSGPEAWKLLLPLLALMAAAYLSPSAQSFSLTMQGIERGFSSLSLLFAFSSMAAAAYLLAKQAPPSHAIMFLLGIISSGASAAGAAIVLSIPAASGLQAGLREDSPKMAKLILAYAFGFFAAFALVYHGGDAIRPAAISLMLAALFPMTMHFYDYKSARFFAVAAMAALLFSAFSLAFLQHSPTSQNRVFYSDEGLSQALLSLSETAGQGPQVYVMGGLQMVRFYLPSSEIGSQRELQSFLEEGSPALPAGSYALLSPSYFDEGTWESGGGEFEAYYFAGDISSGNSLYALFYSQQGALIRPIDSSGNFVVGDGQLLDASGRPYFTIPYPRMLVLRQDVPYQSPANRLLVLNDGALPPHALKVYAGTAPRTAKVGEFGQISIYRVS